MRKGKSISGLRVIGQSDGSDLGGARTVIFDHESSQVLGILVSEKELFGLIDAQVVPWSEVRNVGADAVMVSGREALIKAHEDARIGDELDGHDSLVGRSIHTTDGKNLGAFSDIFFEDDGRIVGYEVSGGVFSDMATGRRFMPVPSQWTLGEDIALVPPGVATQMEAQKDQDPGGLKAVGTTVGEKVGGVYDTAKDKVTETYSHIATASIEKQKEFVIGKTASRDVIIPATKTSSELNATNAVENTGTYRGTEIIELITPTMAGSHDVSSSGEAVDGEVLVRSGEIITQEHADRAEHAGVLGQLLIAAGGGAASGAYSSGKEHVVGATGPDGADLQGRAEASAIGKPAAREVNAPDGTTLIAPGMIVTREIIEHARTYGKEKEVVASATAGGASEAVQSSAETVKEGAANLWDTVKAKASELTGAAHEKKAEYNAQAEQKRINNALGRPTTRVILDQSDNVILNTGDLITHKAIDDARSAGALEVLLDSVYEADPEITPEMLRAQEPGEAALPTQAEPSGGPITATVAPDQPAQDTPSQGQY